METLDTPLSAGDAFEKNSIPVIRDIEKQLRASVSRDRERLRALVGGNYRDLLSTADEIVTLDRRTKETELQISDLSRQCKPPPHHEATRSISITISTSAQLRLLTRCLTCATSALQARSVLLCAELTVISRLLLKALGEQHSPPKAIEGLGNKAATLRRRLLRLIKSQLAHPSSEIDYLVQAICAYCLVTSASSGDAIEHFRNVRLDKLRQRIDSAHENHSQIKENFQYLVVSVQLVKSLLGRSVNDALTTLQKQPILQDQTILRLEALDIDRLSNLIPQDILSFIPYIKRVLLKQDEVTHISTLWIQDACQIFEKGLQLAVANTKSVVDILTLRKDLCSIVLPVYFSTPGHEVLLTTVRQVTNARISESCRSQIEALANIGREIVSTKTFNDTTPSLWDTDLVQKSLASNSESYVRHVRAVHTGTKGDLSTLVKRIRKWARQVAQLQTQFQILEATRWHDSLEEPDDEDEDVAQKVVSQLSKDDPNHFKDAMDSSIQSTITEFNKIMHGAISEATETTDDDDSKTAARIVYLHRALRESSTILISSIPTINLEVKDLALKLHKALAESVTKQILSVLSKDLTVSTITSHPLEDLPSPQAFKLLSDISKAMTDIGGTDVWSEAAVISVKRSLHAKLLDGDEYFRYKQDDFDKCYLAAALDTRGNTSRQPPDSNETQIKAHAYWQRTRLLFGVLA